MKKRKLFVNEKLDLLYSVIWILVVIILVLFSKLMDFRYTGWLRTCNITIMIIVPNLITSLRRKKQVKKIECLRQILGISIDEIRRIAGIKQYDLVDWKWDRAYIPQKKMYLLEDALEKKYIQEYGHPFEFESSASISAESKESASK